MSSLSYSLSIPKVHPVHMHGEERSSRRLYITHYDFYQSPLPCMYDYARGEENKRVSGLVRSFTIDKQLKFALVNQRERERGKDAGGVDGEKK